MKRMLVATDFSRNSRAGIRFAIQLASQQNFSLTFFYSCNLNKPLALAEPVFGTYQKSEFKALKAKLGHFVHSVYKSIAIDPENVDFVVKSSSFPDQNIMNYAAQQAFDFICMSWSGGGRDKSHFGPNTFNLITRSDIPVIAVPDNYRRSRITRILYASDLLHFTGELKAILDFARPLNAKIEVLHFNFFSDRVWDVTEVKKSAKRVASYDIEIHMEDPDDAETFVSNLERAVKKSKPSMIIMFRHQSRTFFEHFFGTGRPAKYLFYAEIPLLVFKKL